MANTWGNSGNSDRLHFGGSKITADGDWSHEIKRGLLLGRKVITNLNSSLKKQRHYFVNKGPSSQSYGFSNSHVWMWKLDCKESWEPKNWCFWSVVLEMTLNSLLDCKEIQPVHPKGYQSWIFIGRTDAEGETPILWPPGVRNWLIGKDPDAGKDWRQKEKGMKRMRWLDGITTQWAWVYVNSGHWWWTGRPGMLQSMRSQIVRHDWETELNNILKGFQHTFIPYIVFLVYSVFLWIFRDHTNNSLNTDYIFYNVFLFILKYTDVSFLCTQSISIFIIRNLY